MLTTRQRQRIAAIAIMLGLVSVAIVNWLLHSSQRPWVQAGLNLLILQSILGGAAVFFAVALIPFRRTRRAGLTVAAASLTLLSATAVSAAIWTSTPAHLMANVSNSSPYDIAEVIFTAGAEPFRFTGLAPGEDRAFRFSVGSHEGSMVVRGKMRNGQEASAECHTYINWALSRASFDVEVFAADEMIGMRCVQREYELKF